MKSEKHTYMEAIEMIAGLRIDLESIRLDKYYSGQSILDDFPKIQGYSSYRRRIPE